MVLVRWVRVWRGPCSGLLVPVAGRGPWRVKLGGYEAELGRWFRELVRPGDWVVDVGCGVGYYTLAAAKRGAVVLGLDADGERVAAARAALRVNGLPGMVVHDHVSSLPWGVDAVKMDVEGAEVGILEESRELLEECGPRLLVEVHGTEALMRCCALLEVSGYVVRKVPMVRSVFRQRVDGQRAWLWGVPDEA